MRFQLSIGGKAFPIIFSEDCGCAPKVTEYLIKSQDLAQGMAVGGPPSHSSEAGVAIVASCFQAGRGCEPLFDVASEGHEMHLALPLPSAPVRLEHREL